MILVFQILILDVLLRFFAIYNDKLTVIVFWTGLVRQIRQIKDVPVGVWVMKLQMTLLAFLAILKQSD